MGSPPRSTVLLGALAVAAFQVFATFGASAGQPDRRGVDAVAVVLLLVGPAALAFRDRRPLVAVAVAGLATDAYVGLGYAYGPVFLGVIVALFGAVLAGHRQSTWALAAAVFAGFVVATAVDDRSDGPTALHLALVVGWLVVVLAVAELVRGRAEQAAARRRAEADERQRRLDEQRLDLARDLHDTLAHNIALINVQAGVALHLLDDEPERAGPALTEIKAASKEALQELRSALDVLRTGDRAAPPRAPAPGLDDVPVLVESVRASGLDVRLELAPPSAVPASVGLAAYRIVQEALTNVTRHARARAAVVRIGHDDGDGLSVEVVDDGVGGTAAVGNGIVGMRERAAALGGTVTAGRVAGGGFRVAAHLPVGQAP